MAVTVSLALLATACGSGADTLAASNATAQQALASAPATASPAPGARGRPADRNDFAGFWTRFRDAALNGDAAALKAMSAPTALAHGELDDPTRRLAPAQVPAALAKVMAATETLDAQGHTQRTLVQATTRLATSDTGGQNEHRIGAFVFKLDAKGVWHLTDLYAGSE